MSGLWSFDRVSFRQGGRPVLEGASLSIAAGEVVGVLGPNGAGKTTLIRAGLGLVEAQGAIELGGKALKALSELERAARAGYLPQERRVAWNLPAWRVAALGAPSLPARKARNQALAALDDLGLSHLAERGVLDMSGGERAKVLLARLLVTNAPLLVADEPAAGLDPDAQIMILERLAEAAGQGAGVVVTLHDLTLAARHCQRLIVVSQGRIAADGPPSEALSPQILREVFGLDGALISSPAGLVLAAKRIAA